MTFAGKRAIVTGGTRGIGRAISELLIRQGAEVHATYRTNTEAALDFTDALAEEGLHCTLHQGDVTDSHFAQSVFAQMKELGGVDILINNAGITADQLFLRMSQTQWRDVLSTNLDAPFLWSQLAAKQMMRKQWGRIVNITSPSAEYGRMGQANYAASKAGLNALTKTMAQELARYHITVNAVSAGLTDTSMTSVLSSALQEAVLGLVPMGRKGSTWEVASAVVYVCSEAAGYMTGMVLGVTGGI